MNIAVGFRHFSRLGKGVANVFLIRPIPVNEPIKKTTTLRRQI